MIHALEVATDADKDISSLFLTGGTGFFGRSILRRMADAHRNGDFGVPPTVTVLSRSPERFLAAYPEFSGLPWLSFHEGDVMSGPSAFPSGRRFSHVLHAAADSTLGPKMAFLDRFEQNVTGTRNVLDFAVRAGAKRFLLTSSGGVYGVQPADMERIPESFHGMPDPLLSENTYGVSKRLAEHLCVLYGDKFDFEVVVARCFAFVGPDLPMDAHFAIGNFIRDALERPGIVVKGNGSPLRSYLYQDDLVDWLLTLLKRGRRGQAYNVGSDQAISIADLAHLVGNLIAPEKPILFEGDIKIDSSARNRYVPDIEKAHGELGLHVSVPLEEAIRLTAQSVSRTMGNKVNA